LSIDVKREVLRHMVATVAYRGGIAVSDAPENFSAFRVAEATRTPGEILAHIGDLLEGSLYLLKGELVYLTSACLPWDAEVARFFGDVKKLDSYLASDAPLALWPGAGTGQGREGLLRAHPLIDDGVIHDAVFGHHVWLKTGVMLGLYVFGTVTAMCMALLLKKTLLAGPRPSGGFGVIARLPFPTKTLTPGDSVPNGLVAEEVHEV